MSGRRIQADRHAWLVGELKAWVALGLLMNDQPGRILRLYEVIESPEAEAAAAAAAETARRTNRAASAVMALGAVLIGLAALSAVASNWRDLSTTSRFGLVLTTLAATYWTAWKLRRAGAVEGSNIAAFLGCLLYGAAIWLVAQTFNVSSGLGAGFWWWGVGVLPIALVLEAPPLHALAVAALACFVGDSAMGSPFGPFGQTRTLAFSTWSVPLLTIPGFVRAYAARSRSVLAMYVALATLWVVLQPTSWERDASVVFWIGMVGSLLMLIGECHSRASGLGLPYRFFGVALVGGTLLFLSAHAFHRTVHERGTSVPLAIETAAAVIVAATVATVVSLPGPKDWVRRRPPGGVMAAEPRIWFPMAMAGLFALLTVDNALAASPVVGTILANAAAMALAVWLTVVGAHEDRAWPFAAGVGYFLLWAGWRYLDLFSDFGGMLGAAAAFLACGAALIGAAVLWRRMREVRHVHA